MRRLLGPCGVLVVIGCGRSTGAPSAGPAADAGELDAAAFLPDADPAPPPTLGAVDPAHAFLARHREILLTGYSTHWSGATRVDLGPDVTVTNLSAPRSDLLAVDFGVAPTATPGPRDVSVVEQDGGAVTGRGALTLDPPVALSFEGTLAEGSIVVAHATVVDPSIPLDTTATTDAFGVPTFVDLAPLLPAGLSGTVLAARRLGADLQVFIDTGAAGAASFDLLSGPPGSSSVAHFPVPGGVNVAARTALPLMAGQPVGGSVDTSYATALFTYVPPAALSIVDVAATSGASGADPAVLLLPSSGRWSDELTGGVVATWVTSSSAPIYAVYFDDAGKTGAFSVDLTATTPASSAGPTATDATMAGAVLAPALPFVFTGGQLASASSQDWIRVATGPADAGRRLHVQSAGDPRTALDVTLYDDQGSSIGGNETGGPVNAYSVPLGASRTYYVAFSAGAGFDPAHGGYDGIVRLQ